MDNKIRSRVLNERQFAEAVGVSYAFIKRLRRQGSFKGFCRVGRRVLYKNPEHVEAFLNQFEKAV